MTRASPSHVFVVVAASLASGLSHAQGLPASSPLQRPQRPVPALLPPEIPASVETGIGLQIRFVGRHAASMDSPQRRAIQQEMCRALGRSYVNEAPLGEHGRFEEWRVQLGMRSYTWYEGRSIRADRDDFCRWRLARQRVLTVAVYDGERTTLHRYDYEEKTVRVLDNKGDQTALGAEAPRTRPGLSLTDLPTVGRRVIASLPCTEHLIAAPGAPDGSGQLRCVTSPDPFDGRRAPVVLKERIGDTAHPITEWEAVEVLPRVEVNQRVFRGPPFFRVLPPPRPAQAPAPRPEGAR